MDSTFSHEHDTEACREKKAEEADPPWNYRSSDNDLHTHDETGQVEGGNQKKKYDGNQGRRFHDSLHEAAALDFKGGSV